MLVLRGFLLVKLASTGDEGSGGDACLCQFLLMMLASGCDAGSAGVSCWCWLLILMLVLRRFSADKTGIHW